jgi:hypothetical protein
VKRPQKPMVPYLPEVEVYQYREIDLYEGDSLAQILAQLPPEIRHDDVTFETSLSGSVLNYKVGTPNKDYDKQYALYQRELKQYEDKLVLYELSVAEYNKWFNEKERERKLALLEQLKKELAP